MQAEYRDKKVVAAQGYRIEIDPDPAKGQSQ